MTHPPNSRTVITPDMYSRGITVVHTGPFSELEVPVDHDDLPPAVHLRWVRPHYLKTLSTPSAIADDVLAHFAAVDATLIRVLLRCVNWRPRSVAAILAALLGDKGLTDDLGKLLLRSDVCYAGRSYCYALACFNTQASIAYLQTYLRHYLYCPTLWFDQAYAMAALRYCDARNGTRLADEFDEAWTHFVADKPG